MIKLSVELIFRALLYFSCSQSPSETVQISFKNETLEVTKNSPHVTIQLVCKNRGDKNLLLYGIMSNLRNNADTARLCNVNRVGGGIGVMVFDNKLSPVYAVEAIPDSIKQKRLDAETFRNEMLISKGRFLEGTRVLKASETLELVLRLDLRQYNLRPGEYYVKILYYAGEGLRDDFVVGTKQIQKDADLFDAELYQGCSISNQLVMNVR